MQSKLSFQVAVVISIVLTMTVGIYHRLQAIELTTTEVFWILLQTKPVVSFGVIPIFDQAAFSRKG